jgi:hypothetical protein
MRQPDKYRPLASIRPFPLESGEYAGDKKCVSRCCGKSTRLVYLISSEHTYPLEKQLLSIYVSLRS